MNYGKAARAAHRGDGGDPQKAILLGGEQLSNSTLPEAPQAARLWFELRYTRDDRIDTSDGGWCSVPQEPAGIGWLLWDTIPDRKTGWLRILADRPRTLPRRGPRMSLPAINVACTIKRGRPFGSTEASTKQRRRELIKIVGSMHPMTVRQAFYQATVCGLVEKTEVGYRKVQTDLVLLRRSGEMPYGWITDNTRLQRKPDSFCSITEALEDTARFYRKNLWHDADSYVEIWIEKDALSGVVYPVTSRYDVPLMVARGYASLSFLHGSADYIADLDVPAHIYHFGDFDPSGVNAAEKIDETLRELAPGAEIYFERVAVTEEQIEEWNLPTRPTKKSDTRSRGFGDISVELDAIAPGDLRDLVEQVINQHLPQNQLRILQEAERSEREFRPDRIHACRARRDRPFDRP